MNTDLYVDLVSSPPCPFVSRDSTRNRFSLTNEISLEASVSPLLSWGSGTTYSAVSAGRTVAGWEMSYDRSRVYRELDFLLPPSWMVADWSITHRVFVDSSTVRHSKPIAGFISSGYHVTDSNLPLFPARPVSGSSTEVKSTSPLIRGTIASGGWMVCIRAPVESKR